MRFTSIGMTNFMSFKSDGYKYPEKGLYLITGINHDDTDSHDSNGSGKSAFTEAPLWALFGRLSRGGMGDDVIRLYKGKRVKDPCYVTLLLEDNGVSYTIQRGRHPSFLRFWKVDKKIGKEITCPDQRDTQELIIDEIGMDYDTFTNSALFGQQVTDFFAAATDGKKKEIFDRILMFQSINAARAVAKTRAYEQETELAALLRSVEEADRKVSAFEVEIVSLRTDGGNWQAGQDKRVVEINATINVLQARVEPDLDKQIDKREGLLREYATASTAGIQTRQRHAYLNGDYNKHRARYDSGTDDILRFEKFIVESEKKKGTRCVTCFQIIRKEGTAAMRENIEDQIKSSKVVMDAATSSMEKIVKELDELILKTHDYDAIMAGIDKPKIEAELNKLRTQKADDEAAAERINDLTKDRNVLEKEQNPYVQLIADKRDSILTTNAVRGAQMAEARGRRITCDLYKFWSEVGFGNAGLKSQILRNVTPYLNSQANYFSQWLTGGGVQIELDTQTKLKSGEMREKLDLKITSRVGSLAHRLKSGGEKRRIDLCVLLALQSLVASRVAKRFQMSFYDEVFDSLDDTGTERAVRLLEDMSAKQTIFVVSHDHGLQGHFHNEIRIEKRDDASTIVV